MAGSILGYLFRIICLAATGALFLRGYWKYLEDRSSTQIEYKTFHDTKRDIYPTITFCIRNSEFKNQTGLYDRQKLNEKYEIKDPLEYRDFLRGYIWKDKFAGVNYDDVTLDIKDRVEEVTVISDTWQVLYSWKMNDKPTNDSLNRQDSVSMDTQKFPFYTSYRHAYEKCSSMDLSVDEMPNIQGQLIRGIQVKLRNIKIADLRYMISYPGQILLGYTIDMEFGWNQRITSGYVKVKSFLVDMIAVYRKRNTFHNECSKHWTGYDEIVFRDIIKTANCRPPHWNISSEYPICNSKEKMKNVAIPQSIGKTASSTFLKKFLRPCDGILEAKLKTVSERRQMTFGGSISTDGVDAADVEFLFMNDHYKEIKYTREFDIESLIGNVGGYIGLFLGFAIWQLPDVMVMLASKFCNRIEGKIHPF